MVRRRIAAGVLVGVIGLAGLLRADGPARAAAGLAPATQLNGETLPDLLDRVGRRVEDYFARATSVVARESVLLQPVGRDLMPDGAARHLVYELRVSWEPPELPGSAPEVSVLRQILTINGRKPREGRRDDEDARCLDPKAVSPEPLAMLLPAGRGAFAFTPAGPGRTDGRPALMIDFRSTAPKTPPTVTWYSDTCGNIDMPGYVRGRIWVDAVSGDVLRLDEALQGYPEVRVPRDKIAKGFAPTLRVERADSSIRYRTVKFTDPEEYLLLPAAMESVTVIVGSGTPRRRTVHRFSDYKRFLTSGRIVTRP